jgi:prephenate dehydrogenase
MIRTAVIVGTGLIGTSVGLALSRRGVRVHLVDVDPQAARVAAALGAGTLAVPTVPVDLAVLAVPPRNVVRVLAEQQDRGLALTYTDVASVKDATARAVAQGVADHATYVGGHPMAGSERSGPLAARADLFDGCPWVLTPAEETTPGALNRVLAAVALCGAVPVVMDPRDHDRAVALVSHAPHLVASLMAARLRGAPDEVLRLAGRGVRDVTRIAGGDPRLWRDIIGSNAAHVADALGELAEDLKTLMAALRAAATAGPDTLAAVEDLLDRGRHGWQSVHGPNRIPPGAQVTLHVAVAGRPGELGRLLEETAEFGVDTDSLRLGLPCDSDAPVATTTGPAPDELLAHIAASPGAAELLRRKLVGGGWRVSVAPRPVRAPGSVPAAATVRTADTLTTGTARPATR